MRLLLIEDNRDIAGVIFDYFEALGHAMDYTADGNQGLALATENAYDLVILDIMLPGRDGYSVCRALRERQVDTPILMLTARDTTDDTLQGFGEGADDYLVKPFDLKVLQARIEAIVRRRSGGAFAKHLSFDVLTLDLGSHAVERQGHRVSLNPTCFKLLKALMQKAPELVTREELVYSVWKDEPPDGDSLRNHIYQLRNLIDRPFTSSMLVTVPKTGYRLQPASEEPEEEIV